MKKKLNKILEYIGHIFIYYSCFLNLPYLCALIIKISLSKKKFFNNKIDKKKIAIVLDRTIGHRDIEIIQENTNKAPEFLFLRRSITKIILYYFSDNKKFLFNFLKPPVYEEDYHNQSEYNKLNHKKFWFQTIFHLKNFFQNKEIIFITFNFTYYAEDALYFGCNKNNIKIKLWHKEGIKTDLEANQEIKTWGKKFKHVFRYFDKISVYNKLIKKMFIKIDPTNKKKISINGCPRIQDYKIEKRYNSTIKNILFLYFDSKSKRGIPNIKKNKNLNWNLSHKKVLNILNNLAKNKDIKILIKRKSNSSDLIKIPIDQKIEIISSGTADSYINNADIVIGHNSASTIEALINGKYVFVPFFEKDNSLKKYLYKFDKKIIFTSEEKLEKKILSLINKKISFPLNNKQHYDTIEYYLGNQKNITKKYLNFLN